MGWLFLNYGIFICRFYTTILLAINMLNLLLDGSNLILLGILTLFFSLLLILGVIFTHLSIPLYCFFYWLLLNLIILFQVNLHLLLILLMPIKMRLLIMTPRFFIFLIMLLQYRCEARNYSITKSTCCIHNCTNESNISVIFLILFSTYKYNKSILELCITFVIDFISKPFIV
jgi:hypothetical protein